jgi:hypothetical protein
MITIQKVTGNLQSVPRQSPNIYCRLSLTPSVIPNSNYVIVASDWNGLKHFCLFLYCNHQVHRDFLITLYNVSKRRAPVTQARGAISQRNEIFNLQSIGSFRDSCTPMIGHFAKPCVVKLRDNHELYFDSPCWYGFRVLSYIIRGLEFVCLL